MIATDWGFWGVIVAVAAIVIGGAIAILIYILNKHDIEDVEISVSAEFDKTGMTHVLINKTGNPPVHVRDVKLIRAGNKVLQVAGRYPTGEFEVEGPSTAGFDCYILLKNALSAEDAVEVQVWLDATTVSKAMATWSEVAIKLPEGMRLQPATRSKD